MVTTCAVVPGSPVRLVSIHAAREGSDLLLITHRKTRSLPATSAYLCESEPRQGGGRLVTQVQLIASMRLVRQREPPRGWMWASGTRAREFEDQITNGPRGS